MPGIYDNTQTEADPGFRQLPGVFEFCRLWTFEITVFENTMKVSKSSLGGAVFQRPSDT